MSDTTNVTIIGHSSSRLNELEAALQLADTFDISRKLMLQGAVDPFEDLAATSGVLVLDLDDTWREVLNAVSSRIRRNKVPMILIGPDGDTEMVRAALKAGARDFQTRPLNNNELIQSVRQLGDEKQISGADEAGGSLAVFISARGGAGASAIVAGMGYALARRSSKPKTLLLDLDLQFGNLPLYFDETPTTHLTQALLANERIDGTLLDACLLPGPEGIDLLASTSEQVFSSWDAPQASITNLINLISDRYNHVLVDIPRHIDPVSFQAVERASSVNIVMQQTLIDLRYTKQIIGLLRDQGLPNNKLRIIVNRHDKSRVLRTDDITDAFDGIKVFTLPNDYKRMSFATGNAVPLLKKYQKAPLSKRIVTLSEEIFPEKIAPKKGWLRRKR